MTMADKERQSLLQKALKEAHERVRIVEKALAAHVGVRTGQSKLENREKTRPFSQEELAVLSSIHGLEPYIKDMSDYLGSEEGEVNPLLDRLLESYQPDRNLFLDKDAVSKIFLENSEDEIVANYFSNSENMDSVSGNTKNLLEDLDETIGNEEEGTLKDTKKTAIEKEGEKEQRGKKEAGKKESVQDERGKKETGQEEKTGLEGREEKITKISASSGNEIKLAQESKTGFLPDNYDVMTALGKATCFSKLSGEESYDIVRGKYCNLYTDHSISPEAVAEFKRMGVAFETSRMGIWEWNLAENRVYVSQYWEEFFCKCEAQGSPIERLLECVDPANALDLSSVLDAVLRGEVEKKSITVRFLHSSESTVWAKLYITTRRGFFGEAELLLITAIDISSQCRKALLLRDNCDRYRSLGEGSPDFIVRLDSEVKIIDVGKGIAAYLPVPHADLEGKAFSSLFKGDDIGKFLEIFSRVFKSGEIVRTELLLSSCQIGRFLSNCTFWPEIDEDGFVSAVVVKVWDMTTTKRMAENYQALFTTMVDGFALFKCLATPDEKEVKPQDFLFIVMNPALGRLLRINHDLVRNKPITEISDEYALQWAESLKKVFISGKPIVYSIKVKEFNLLLEISAFSPSPDRVACIVKDITAQQAAEETMLLNDARFAALYRLAHMYQASMPELIQYALNQAVELTGSLYGHIAFINSATSKMQLFWSDIDISGKEPECIQKDSSISSLLNKDKIYMPSAVIVNDASKNSSAIRSKRFQMKRYMLAPVIDDGRVVCVAVVANKEKNYALSDLRQLELFVNGLWFQLRRRWANEHLMLAKEEAEAANQAKDVFLANVSHELRTPLNGILGMLQLLQHSELTKEQREWAEVASYSGRGLMRIISDILNVARIESNNYFAMPYAFDFTASFRSCMGVFLHNIRQKKFDFELFIDEKVPSILVGDEGLVRQILLNIVGNAFKFTSHGRIRVECYLLSASSNGQLRVYIAVHDTGIGMSEKSMKNIFEPFAMIDSSSTRSYSGAGLGLNIVKRLVLAMGGSLCMDSEEGKGTSVYLSLPFQRGLEELIADLEDTDFDGPTKTLDILVAEDDPVNQLTIKTMLEKSGHKVFCVNNGREAIEALLLNPFDCLFTDLQMPVMDGEEVVERIRSGRFYDVKPSHKIKNELEKRGDELLIIPAELPIVALTAHAMGTIRKHLLGLGVDYYLCKPLEYAKLKNILKRLSFFNERIKQ